MCNHKGKLIYRAHLQRKEYHQYLKVYKDDYGNLSYDVVMEDYRILNRVDVFDCKTRFPDVIQEIPAGTFEVDIRKNVLDYFNNLLETGSFELVESKSF